MYGITALFIGNADDVVPETFGPDLPGIRAWTEAQFTFPGYVQYFDPKRYTNRTALRARLGFEDGARVVVAAVGGTAVGRSLLKRIIYGVAETRRRMPELHAIIVAGPRIEPASLPSVDGVEVRGYVPALYELLAASDLALVQGGLSTTMELVATGRPFLYFPLRNHFEQTFHVPHRLANYGVLPTARLDYATAMPDLLAERIISTLSNVREYRPVETGGAERAARLIAELVS
jgi:predicted glycosyltransferase